MAEKIDPDKVIAKIPNHETIFTASLNGRPLEMALHNIDNIVSFLESYRPMATLEVMKH